MPGVAAVGRHLRPLRFGVGVGRVRCRGSAVAALVLGDRRRALVLFDGAVAVEPQVRLAPVAEHGHLGPPLGGELDERVAADHPDGDRGRRRRDADDLGRVVGRLCRIGVGHAGRAEHRHGATDGDEPLSCAAGNPGRPPAQHSLLDDERLVTSRSATQDVHQPACTPIAVEPCAPRRRCRRGHPPRTPRSPGRARHRAMARRRAQPGGCESIVPTGRCRRRCATTRRTREGTRALRPLRTAPRPRRVRTRRDHRYRRQHRPVAVEDALEHARLVGDQHLRYGQRWAQRCIFSSRRETSTAVVDIGSG